MAMSFAEWKEMAVTNYDIVSINYGRKVYESVVTDKDTGEGKFVQLTLREVLAKCEGTIFEDQIKRAVMKCVYTNTRLEPQIRPIMDIYYS